MQVKKKDTVDIEVLGNLGREGGRERERDREERERETERERGGGGGGDGECRGKRHTKY